MNNKTIIEFSFRIILRIMESSEGFIRLGLQPRRKAPSSISIILHKILRLGLKEFFSKLTTVFNLKYIFFAVIIRPLSSMREYFHFRWIFENVTAKWTFTFPSNCFFFQPIFKVATIETKAQFSLAHKHKHKHKDIRTRRMAYLSQILDTSSPQPNDKQDGGRSVRHIAFDMFA